MPDLTPVIEKSFAGILSGVYRYTYVMNNPLKYTDPSGYKFAELPEPMIYYNMGWLKYSGYGWTEDFFGGHATIKRWGGGGTGPSSSDYIYWVKNIRNNPLYGEDATSVGKWWWNGKNTKADMGIALQLGLLFLTSQTEETSLYINSDGTIYTYTTDFDRLVEDYNSVLSISEFLNGSNPGLSYNDNYGDIKSTAAKAIATYLRNSPLLSPGLINPFFQAEAIMGDVGLLFMAEFDVGGVFPLIGKDKGVFKTYHEVAIGISVDGNLGAELARVDYYGKVKNFALEFLEGDRFKIFGSAEALGVSMGGSIAVGQAPNGRKIQITGISLGIGATLFGGFNGIGGGGNWGMTDIHQ